MENSFDTYFSNRLSNDVESLVDSKGQLLDSSSKYESLMKASADKSAALANIRSKIDRDRNSLVNKLGLTPDTLGADLVNLGASFTSGASRVAGHLAALPFNLQAMTEEASVSPAHVEAYARYKQGSASEQDMALLNEGLNDQNNPGEGYIAQSSPLLRLEAAAKARERATRITEATDLTGLVQQGSRDSLNTDLSKGFEQPWGQVTKGWEHLKKGEDGEGWTEIGTGIAKLLVTAVESGVKNPQASAEYIVENIPQLALGLAGKAGQVLLGTSNIGYAADEYRKGIVNYQKDNNGALPDSDTRQEMAIRAASLALAEQVGDVASLGVIKTTKDAARTGFKQSLLNTAKAAGTGYVTEAATEGYQTHQEQRIESALTKEADPLQTYQGAAIGGIAGSGMSAGGRGVAELAQATPEHVAQQIEKEKESTIFADAMRTGNLDAFTNKESASYNPAKAIAVLFAKSDSPDVSLEQKQEYQAKATELINTLASDKKELERSLRQETQAGIQEELVRLNKLKQDKPEHASVIDEAIAANQERLTAIEASGENTAAIADLKKKLSDVDSQMQNADALNTALSLKNKPIEADVTSLVSLLNSPVDIADVASVEKSNKASKTLLNLAMMHPDSISQEQANQLLSNESNSLSQEVRNVLRKILHAKQSMDAVSSEVFNGTPNNLGIKSYNSIIGAALATSNFDRAEKHLMMLANFVAGHKGKLDLFEKAYQEARGTGKAIQFVPTKDEGWIRLDKNIDLETLNSKDIRGIQIDVRSPKLIRNLRNEVAALDQTYDAWESATSLTAVDSQAATAASPNTTTVNQSNVDTTVDQNVTSTTAVDPLQDVQLELAQMDDPNAPGYVPPWDSFPTDNSLDVPLDGSVEDDLKKHYKGKNLALTTDNSVRRVMNSHPVIQALSSKFLSAIATVSSFESPTVQGQMADINGKKVIVLAEALLGDFKLVFRFNHELAHAFEHVVDLTQYGKGTEVFNLASSISKTSVLGKTLNYPLGKTNLTDFEMSQELHAQLFSLYISQPTLLQKGAPELYAFMEKQYGSQDNQFLGRILGVSEGSGRSSSSQPNPDSQKEQLGQEAPASVSEAVQDIAQDPAEAEKPSLEDGKLVVFNQPSTLEGKNLGEDSKTSSKKVTFFQLANLVKEFLTQSSNKEDDQSPRPLVGVKDFLSHWVNGDISLTQYMKADSLTQKQEAFLNHFKDLATKWNKSIKEGLLKGQINKGLRKDANGKTYKVPSSIDYFPEYYYREPIKFLMESSESGTDMEENIKTAISAAAFQWVAENAGGAMYKSMDQVKQMLGLKEQDEISYDLYKAMHDKGDFEKVIINAIGQRVVEALGLQVTDKATVELLPKLASDFGLVAVKLLWEQGLIERVELPFETLKEGLPAEKAASVEEVAQGFIRFVRNENKELNTQAQAISDLAKETQGVFSRLFGTENSLIEPSWKPINSQQKKAKGSKQSIPAKLMAIIKHENSVASYVREDVYGLLQSLGKDLSLKIAGFQDISEETMHITNRIGAEVSNNALEREYTRMMDYFAFLQQPKEAGGSSLGLMQPLYFLHSVWKQQRVGITTNVINPQTSKLQRWSLYRKEWETKVSLDSQEMMESFKLRVLEGLGTKTEQKYKATALEEFNTLFDRSSSDEKSVALFAAIDALRATVLRKEAMTEQYKQDIVDGVSVGGEKMHSLDALIAMAQYEEAKATNSQEFTTRLMGEIDGVTNGPMLSHLLLGAGVGNKLGEKVNALFGLLNRGGFYRNQDLVTNYNDYRGTAGNRDLYEFTIGKVIETLRMNTLADVDSFNIFKNIEIITGTLEENGAIKKAGRNIIKTPLTAMVFGSNMQRSVESMFETFVSKIYSNIEDIAALPKEEQEEAINKLTKVINELLGAGHGKRHGFDKIALANNSLQDLLNNEFSKAQTEALRAAFNRSLGKAVTQTMEREFAGFLKTRDTLNTIARNTFMMYYETYKGIRDNFIQELMEANKISYTTGKDGRKIPQHELTVAQERELDNRVKSINPVVHTYLSKMSDDINSGISLTRTDRRISQNPTHRGQLHFGKPFPDGKFAFLTAAYEQIKKDPGVAMVPMMVHSSDSAISHLALDGNEVLNIHDAHGTGLKNFMKTGQNLNQNTWSVMLNYSPTAEMRDTWVNMLKGMSDLLKTEDTSKVIPLLKTTIEQMAKDNKTAVQSLLLSLTSAAYETSYQADLVKLSAMQQMVSVDQYALNGGNYVVTEQDRAEVEAKLKELNKEVPSDIRALVENLNQVVLGIAPANPWGDVGYTANKIVSDTKLVEFFEQHSNVSANKMLEILSNRAEELGLNPVLLNTVSTAINPKTRVKYITPSSPKPEGVTPPKGARGWYDPESNVIYVLSPEFKFSGITGELMLHEIFHAALAHAMHSPSSTPAARLVSDLETLLAATQQYVQDNKLKGFENSLTNIHELVSWGMTNKDFQDKVLKKVKYTSTYKTNKLVSDSGMKKLIRSITEFFFGKETKEQNTAMEALVRNVSGLLVQATMDTQEDVDTSFIGDPMAQVNNIVSMSTLEIYDAISTGNVQPTIQDQHRSLLEGIVTKAHGVFGTLKAYIESNPALTPSEVWLNSKQTGRMPFASRIISSSFATNDQTTFVLDQVEATVRTALDSKDASAFRIQRDLSKLFLEARNKLPSNSFLPLANGNSTVAQEMHNFLFNVNVGNGTKSEYLSRFVALSLAHPEVNALMKLKVDSVTPISQGTFTQRLQNLFARVLEWVHNKINKTTPNQTIDQQMSTLVETLVGIESSYKAKLLVASSTNVFDRINAVIKGGVDSVKASIASTANSNVVKNSSSPIVKAMANLVSTVASNRVDFLLEALERVSNTNKKKGQTFVSGFITELRGAHEGNLPFHALIREAKHREQTLQETIVSVSNTVLGSFNNGGKDLSSEQKESILSMLRSDTSNLLSTFSVADIYKMINDPVFLEQNIRSMEGQLQPFTRENNYYLAQSRALGYYLANGKVTIDNMMLNAHNIASMHGTILSKKVTTHQTTAAAKIIDQLVSMYALKYMEPTMKNNLKEVVNAEAARGADSGVEMVLRLHQALARESKDRLFNGNDTLMMKGYMPDIYDPYRKVVIADIVEGQDLVAQGYKQGSVVSTDPHDPNKAVRHFYVLEGGGLRPFLTGATSYTGTAKRGSRAASSNVKDISEWIVNRIDLDSMARSKQRATAQLIRNGGQFDPTTVTTNYAVPVLDDKGNVVDQRYLMQEKTKNVLLKRDTRFEKVLGAYSGSIFDKVSSKEQNRKVVESLFEQFNKDYSTRYQDYVWIGAGPTASPEMREKYQMLPDDMKKAIREVWGKGKQIDEGKYEEGMYVRSDLINTVFGYRKWSLSSPFDKEVRTALEEMFVTFAKQILGEKAAIRIRRFEDAWQELVREAKDFWVIKSVSTLIGNIVSNTFLLAWYGVPIKDIVKHHIDAYISVNSYRKDNERLFEVKVKLKAEANPVKQAKLQQEIALLEDSISRNPVKGLIDEGLLSSIVEDVDPESDLYSYKTNFAKSVEGYTSKIPEGVKAVARTAYMGKDTKMYQALHHLTQVSDFLGRYTMYKHATESKDQPMSHDDAVQLVSDAFVNYDLPSHQAMQYANDVGLVYFTKYYMRIQKVLLHQFRERPAEGLLQVLMGNFFNADVVTNSSFVNHINNPFSMGAFKYLDAIDDAATVKSAMALF